MLNLNIRSSHRSTRAPIRCLSQMPDKIQKQINLFGFTHRYRVPFLFDSFTGYSKKNNVAKTFCGSLTCSLEEQEKHSAIKGDIKILSWPVADPDLPLGGGAPPQAPPLDPSLMASRQSQLLRKCLYAESVTCTKKFNSYRTGSGTPTWPPFHCFGAPIWRT